MKALIEVTRLIEGYKKSKKTEDLEALMEGRRLLSIGLFDLAAEMSDVREMWQNFEVDYENERNSKRILYTESESLAKSDWKARADTHKLKKEALTYELLYKRMETHSHAVREVLSELNQRISFFKQEKKEINNVQ